MSNVLQLRVPANDQAGGYASGDAICVGCKHTWVAVAPVGSRWLECPSCSANKGVFKQPFGADEGDSVFLCSYCDSEALTAYYSDHRFYLRCMGCGVDHTTAIFG